MTVVLVWNHSRTRLIDVLGPYDDAEDEEVARLVEMDGWVHEVVKAEVRPLRPIHVRLVETRKEY